MSLLDRNKLLVGFFSYSREDDKGSAGKLSGLRERIQEELCVQTGRSRREVRLWQDTAALAEGELWAKEIENAINQSVFFIPIVSPRAVRSKHCSKEFEMVLAGE